MSATATEPASSTANDSSIDRFEEDENSTTEAHGPGKNIGHASTSDDATTTGGPDSDVGSVDELPIENGENGEGGVSEDLTQKVSASANYLGSMFSSAWKTTAKTAGDATANSSSLLTTAFTKVTAATSSTKTSPKDENAQTQIGGDPDSASNTVGTPSEPKDTPQEAEESATSAATAAASSFFSSAWNNLGGLAGGATGSAKEEKPEQGEEDGGEKEKEKEEGKEKDENGKFSYETSLAGLTSAFSTFGKVATDATLVLKDKVTEVGTTNMLSEFTKEQETFIKSKNASHSEMGIAPWVGYHDEDELKSKILALSEDKRTFVRAPPSGVTFEFEYSSVSSTALALLQDDPRLQKMRYELVPKKVKEEEFWRNYFYRVSLIKQSFELKDLEEGEKKVKKAQKGHSSTTSSITGGDIHDEVEISNDNGDDEFVSDSYQASTTDIAEAEDSIKKLGVAAKGAEEWEAELEGELNEFEVVNGKEEENPEWENQIDEMLEEEQKA